MRAQVEALASALMFFSRLPVPAHLATVPLSRAIATVPVVGLIVALPGAALMALAAALGADPLLCAALAITVGLVLTGALHEDGLADCADGFWGGASRERRLEIMRDSRIGTYGVLALLCAVLIKAAALQSLLSQGIWEAALVLVAAAAAGRAVALYPFAGLPPARSDGLAVTMGRPTVATFRSALLLAIGITALFTVWWTPIGFVLGALAAALAAKLAAALAERKIGGHTGDVIGATIVVSELSYIVALTLWTV